MKTDTGALRSLAKHYFRFAKWRDEGIWETVFSELKKDADTENLSIDSTCVKGHESADNRKKQEIRLSGTQKAD